MDICPFLKNKKRKKRKKKKSEKKRLPSISFLVIRTMARSHADFSKKVGGNNNKQKDSHRKASRTASRECAAAASQRDTPERIVAPRIYVWALSVRVAGAPFNSLHEFQNIVAKWSSVINREYRQGRYKVVAHGYDPKPLALALTRVAVSSLEIVGADDNTPEDLVEAVGDWNRVLHSAFGAERTNQLAYMMATGFVVPCPTASNDLRKAAGLTSGSETEDVVVPESPRWISPREVHLDASCSDEEAKDQPLP